MGERRGHPGGSLPHQVTGEVMDPAGKVYFLLLGTWDEKMDCYKVAAGSGDDGAEGRQRPHEAEESRVPLWKRNQLPRVGGTGRERGGWDRALPQGG